MTKLAVWMLLSAFGASAFATEHLPFIDDNYTTARAEARRRKLPLFIEVWAPW